VWRNWWNEDWQGKQKYSEKTCPSATMFTTNPTLLDPSVYKLFTDFKKAYDSVRREVLHNILIEFGIPMKQVRLIKMSLNET
jgi:hypothetical protein